MRLKKIRKLGKLDLNLKVKQVLRPSLSYSCENKAAEPDEGTAEHISQMKALLNTLAR